MAERRGTQVIEVPIFWSSRWPGSAFSGGDEIVVEYDYANGDLIGIAYPDGVDSSGVTNDELSALEDQAGIEPR